MSRGQHKYEPKKLYSIQVCCDKVSGQYKAITEPTNVDCLLAARHVYFILPFL